jgi:hypothetical protein
VTNFTISNNQLFMSGSKTFSAVKRTLVVLLCAATGSSFAQYHNLYPCGECAVSENNGSDLKGFIKSNTKELNYAGGMVNEFSDGNWGYMEVKNVRVPSIDQKRNLNYTEYINTTLALYKTKDGAKATWWGRQANTPKGPLVSKVPDGEPQAGMDVVRYYDVTHALEQKKFAIVEYYNDDYNELDYDVLLKNYMLVEHGTVKNINDYKPIIAFYDTFVTKFTYLDDPILGNKSFITFLTANNARYMGYFNMVNGKLAGHLEAVDIQYEKDKEDLVKRTFKKLTGNVVYVYGDDIFGLEKTILNYGHTNKIKLERRKTTTTKKFNNDK